jgi:TPR repeat protein
LFLVVKWRKERKTMKAIKYFSLIAFEILLLATSTNAQFRLINGKVYSLTDSQAGWTVFHDNLRVRGFYENDVICWSYRDEPLPDTYWYVANRQVAEHHSERVWGQKIVLRNYPNAHLLNIGDDITPPVVAMRAGDANVTSSERGVWRTYYSNNSGRASRSSTSGGIEENVLLFDMGAPYQPQLTPEQIAAEKKNQSKQDVKSFHWLQKQATNGDASAQCSLGQRYLTGRGTETNREAAIYWLKQATAQGHEESSNILWRLENPVTNSVSDN